jgi:hypothetical protein
VSQAHRAGAIQRRHLENVVRLPKVRHRVFLETADREGPAHDLNHVGVHIVGTQSDRSARAPQPGRWRRRSPGGISLGDVADRHADLPEPHDVAVG